MKIKVFKYDPAVDTESYYIEYEVPWKEYMTVLEGITYVHEEGEAVNFDYGCHGRLCGRCAVMLDGIPVLACSEPLTDQDHVIEPLKWMTVIHDLIVDKRDFGDHLSDVYARVRVEPITEQAVAREFKMANADILYNVSNCTRCGCCDAICPAKEVSPSEYVGPATMTAVAFRYYDGYDQADRVLEAVGKGLYHCILCGKCDEVCPRPEIKHVEMWKELRAQAEAKGIKPSYAS